MPIRNMQSSIQGEIEKAEFSVAKGDSENDYMIALRVCISQYSYNNVPEPHLLDLLASPIQARFACKY